ncbi:coiled-coil domain-containing protein 172 [Rhinoderma darwinii]|uniref:coiled-coil domain-containing protein 172 n=1 Tax=Rhinoderma darwinii TaxID=43563 RepID=UPI003F667895
MSVESLFQQIVLSQQQAQERSRVLQEVKSEVTNCHEKIIEVKEKLQSAKATQEETVLLVLERRCQRDLLMKCQDGVKVQETELLRDNRDLLSCLREVKDEIVSEEEKFMEEVLDYNNNYGLTVNRKELLRERAEDEGRSLEEAAAVLGCEIETQRGENIHLNALHRQRNVIQRELRAFQETLRGLDKEISAAAGVTKGLEAEKLSVSEKPQRDGECLRLKKDLESYKEENMEGAYEALRTQIAFLQQQLRDVRGDRTTRDTSP